MTDDLRRCCRHRRDRLEEALIAVFFGILIALAIAINIVIWLQ